MAGASKDHRNTVLICSGDDFLITHAATRLDSAACTTIYNYIQAISEWEEGIASSNAALCSLSRTIYGETCRVNPIYLTHSDSDCSTILSQQDGVALNGTYSAPRWISLWHSASRQVLSSR